MMIVIVVVIRVLGGEGGNRGLGSSLQTRMPRPARVLT